jgi:hypothetical protein
MICFTPPPKSLKEVQMRKLWLVAAVTLMALFFGTVTTQYAQNTIRMEGKIPFDFKVGNQSFASGGYSIKSTGVLLQMFGLDSHQNAYLLPSAGKNIDHSNLEKGQLIFTKYGDQYFLSKVVSPSNPTELNLRKSKSEKELIDNLKANLVTNNNTVSIAFNSH